MKFKNISFLMLLSSVIVVMSDAVLSQTRRVSSSSRRTSSKTSAARSGSSRTSSGATSSAARSASSRASSSAARSGSSRTSSSAARSGSSRTSSSAARSGSSRTSSSAARSASSRTSSSAARSGSSRTSSSAARSASSRSSSATKTSAARSASSRSSSGTTTSAARSASSRSSSNVRSAAALRGTPSSNIRSASANTNTNTTTTSSSTPGTLCPINTLIRKTYDEEGNIIYFKSKTVQCAQPENTREEGWDVSSPEKEKEFVIKKSWIADNEGASFVCSNGYLTSGTSGNYSCVSYDQICPLNENIQKSGTSYINPYTGDTCSVPSLAEITNVGTNLYTFNCPDNYYTDSSNYVQCNKCPDGTYSIKGSNKNAASCIVGTVPTATTISDEDFNLILENNPYLLSTVNPEGCPDGTFAEEISETNYLELLRRYAEMSQSYVVSVTPTTRTSSDETTNTETTN